MDSTKYHFYSNFWAEKELGRFMTQAYPTYNNDRCSRRNLSEIDIYYQYIILAIWKHNTFCWMTKIFKEKDWKKVIFCA